MTTTTDTLGWDGPDPDKVSKKGGERPTDQYSYTYQPVSSFWGQGKPE